MADTKDKAQIRRRVRTEEDAEIGGIGVVDILRVLTGVVLLNCAASWLVTGESVLWGYRPWWTSPQQVGSWWKGPLYLTDTELSAYDGSDPSKPIYLALNGSIYDVTAGRETYSPGGSYHFFAGHDAARAFLTGCFKDDITPDMRGVEEMYMPLEDDSSADPEDPSHIHSGPAEVEESGGLRRKGGKKAIPKAELKKQRERDLRIARKRVKEGIENWARTFRGETGRPYFWVGYVKRERGWLEKLPKRVLCEEAKKHKPTRERFEEDVKRARSKEG
ncbi:cytochrome b5 [Patellaria atrata CBS 101060]|uniref:Cytochrome b5 n=1 Tax=Patellaria atrata CBS 101060 TaxID=1346257 RepID=A0A9P4SKJ9_9PEZI|nr:cytochrome b5 [Patellaria atrata CBS 101060]